MLESRATEALDSKVETLLNEWTLWGREFVPLYDILYLLFVIVPFYSFVVIKGSNVDASKQTILYYINTHDENKQEQITRKGNTFIWH